ncbi:MAG: hypothetical protein IJS14_15200 [Lentisphaeria bacterium]|nr:hypothetical protein [Lentisphaeria bacterium]
MADPETGRQMTFDFGDFSDAPGHSPDPQPDRKSPDDLTPGLFDPEVSEEEEMEAFLQTVRSSSGNDPGPEPEPGSDPGELFCPDGGGVSGTEEPEQETEETVSPVASERNKPLTRKQLKRAALLFLASLDPSALAQDVVVRGGRCRAGAAAYWLENGKVVRTAVADIRTAAEAAVEVSACGEQLQMLKLARMEREMLEQEIRRTEPALKEDASLFSEFEQWDYASSSNPAYHECLARISRLEYAVYHGSRLERIRAAESASEMYLVVPENSMEPAVLADGWGLVQVRPDLSCTLVKPAEKQTPPEEKKNLLALNIGAASLPDILFAAGIQAGPDGLVCGPQPRRKRARSGRAGSL